MSRLSGQARRGRALAVFAVGAVLLHAVLLDGLDAAWPGRDEPRAAAAVVQVRQVSGDAAPAVEAPPAARAEPGVAPTPPSRPAPLKRRATPPPPPAAAEPAPIEPTAAAAEVPPTGPAAPAVESVVEVAQRETGPQRSPSAEAPVYRTRFPPALTLDYDLRRGMLQGRGELAWRAAGERYALRLDGRVAALPVLLQTSEGGFDAAGLAPQRFTDRRLRGPVRAANFRRESGTITFSGPSVEYPLVPGVQDRLSWMVQLAAVLTAEPRHAAQGGVVTLAVVGARGDMSLWTFRFDGQETVAVPAGEVLALHFSREPRAAHDTRVEVWLDPARHHLPVRATLRNEGEGEGEAFELLLRSIEPGS